MSQISPSLPTKYQKWGNLKQACNPNKLCRITKQAFLSLRGNLSCLHHVKLPDTRDLTSCPPASKFFILPEYSYWIVPERFRNLRFQRETGRVRDWPFKIFFSVWFIPGGKIAQVNCRACVSCLVTSREQDNILADFMPNTYLLFLEVLTGSTRLATWWKFQWPGKVPGKNGWKTKSSTHSSEVPFSKTLHLWSSVPWLHLSLFFLLLLPSVISLYFLSTKPLHLLLAEYQAATWLSSVVMLNFFSKSVTCFPMCKSLSVYSTLFVSYLRKPPTMQRNTSLPTYSKTCSKRCFIKLVICKRKNPPDSPSWRAPNHTYINGVQFLFCLMLLIFCLWAWPWHLLRRISGSLQGQVAGISIGLLLEPVN